MKMSVRGYAIPLLVLAMVVATILSISPGLAAKRVALVIGNDDYEQVAQLKKAVNDANAIGDVLEGLDFKVIRARNVTRRSLNFHVQQFVNEIEPGDVSAFFFAGHGVEINGENFLLPTDIPDARPGQEGFVRAESVGLNSVLGMLRARKAQLNIVIIDACRENPFAAESGRSVGATRGLARIAAPEGTFVMYSADAGEVALDRLSDDDPHPNSVFTRSLIPLMNQPGVDLVQAAREVRREVRRLARSVAHQQTPAYYDAVLGSFQFVPKVEEFKPFMSTTTDATTTQSNDGGERLRRDYELAERVGTETAWQVFLTRHGANEDSFYVQLAHAALEKLAGAQQQAALSPDRDTVSNSSPAAPPEHACDRLVASTHDLEAVAPGVAFNNIDGSAAVAACQTALQEYPQSPRFAYQLGRAHDKQGTFDQANANYRSAIDRGYAVAMLEFGMNYAVGRGVDKNETEASRLYERAAERGNTEAMFNIGYRYAQGQGVPINHDASLRWYRKAADLGHPKAMYNLGHKYDTAEGIPEDNAEAMRWYRRAADLGHSGAMTNIGFFYSKGEGVTRDDAEAVRWYRKSADLGDPEGTFNLAYKIDHGEGVTEDNEEAFRWYRAAADLDHMPAFASLAAMYDDGEGVAKDPVEASRWMAKALKGGYGFAVNQMTDNWENWTIGFRKELQKVLRDEGVYRGGIDGQFGSGTIAAVKRYAGQ